MQLQTQLFLKLDRLIKGDCKVWEIYYSLLSKGVSVANIGSIIPTVLSLVDIEITDLPSKSTAANMSSEIGLVGQQHLTEVLGNDDKNYTLQRDATTKKGHHYYTNQLATKGITAVLDGKADTYVSSVKEKLSDIDSSGNSSTILNKVSNFMTDRSSTEEKVNKILNESTSQECNSFKCSVHPLLQFSDTCKKELTVMEQELKIKDIDDQKKEIYSATENLLRSVSKPFLQRWHR